MANNNQDSSIQGLGASYQHVGQSCNPILPPLRSRKRLKDFMKKKVKSPLDLEERNDFIEEMKEENASLEDSNDFFERLKNRKLERAGFPSYDKCINNVVLLSVGDSERVYEALICDISLRGRSIRIEPSSRKNGATTISEKMAGWWLIDKLSFIDTIDICNKQLPEKELPRAIV